MKRTFFITGAALTLGVLIGITLKRSNIPVPVMPAAQAAAPSPSLQRQELEGSDIARLLQLDAYKWRYSLPTLPKGRRVTVSLWIEDWRRGSAKPKIYAFGGNVTLMTPQKPGNLLLKIPRTAQEDYVFHINGNGMTGKIEGFSPLVKGPLISEATESQAIRLDRDLILTHKTKTVISLAIPQRLATLLKMTEPF